MLNRPILDLSAQSPAEPQIRIAEEPKADTEPLFKVIIHNDSITPMDFVVEVLKAIFYLSNAKSTEIMLSAHFYGLAYVQTLVRAEAERRVDQAHQAAEVQGYPLRFTIEPE